MKIDRLPRDDKTNGWNLILPHREPHAKLAAEVAADWVVVGAGYAGLAAARRLAENRPGDSIALIEAGIVGENASGRNSGFGIDLPHNLTTSLDELDHSHRYMRLARAALDHLEQTIEAHGIACDWKRAGKYHAAVTPRGAREVLEPFAREMEALGEPYEWVDKDNIRKKVGSDHFTAAVYTPGGVLMNPAALVRGLADSLPGNVTLYENSPVVEIDYANGVRLTTPGGSIRAPNLVVAVNGFAERFGFLRNRLLHLVANASLTRPLNESEREPMASPNPGV